MNHSTRGTLVILLMSVIACIPGCALWPFGDKDKSDDDAETSEQVLYQRTQRSLRAGNYEQAVLALEAIEARFPFGRYADQAQLELIYARYKSFDHDAARAAADRFIRLHPQHANVDYAYYLKGLAAYSKNHSMMDRLFSTDISKRDNTSAREAYADFGQLLARYPHSEYAADAKQRMIYLRNILAQSELNVGDYYMRRGAWVAAGNRARYVIETYPKSSAIADALALSIEANYQLGLKDAANDALRILAGNFPDYPAFDKSGQLVLARAVRNRDRSWLNLMTLGLLDRPDVPPPFTIQNPTGLTTTEPSDSSTTPQQPSTPIKQQSVQNSQPSVG